MLALLKVRFLIFKHISQISISNVHLTLLLIFLSHYLSITFIAYSLLFLSFSMCQLDLRFLKIIFLKVLGHGNLAPGLPFFFLTEWY